MNDCRLVYVECCYGLLVRPAHGCKWLPVCVCGWLGTEYHSSQLEASQEGTAHVDGMEYIPPWERAMRRTQTQRLVNKLRALQNARLAVSRYWDNGQDIPDE